MSADGGGSKAMNRELHYPGDQRAAVGQVIGPTVFGEYVQIESVEFDSDANQSTAHVRYVRLNRNGEVSE